MNRGCFFVWAVLCISTIFSTAQAQTSNEHLVLTSLQATYSITSALSKSTQIRVINVPSQSAVMDTQAFALTRVDDAIFKQAEAVVTISKLWREDPLYPAARTRNIHVINIDASFPWNAAESGVGVIRKPLNNVPWDVQQDNTDASLSRYMWLSSANAIRMAELIAADLVRLSPKDAQQIQENLAAFTVSIRQFSAEYGARFAVLPDPRVFSLADEFVYLLSDLGIYVDGWFIKQDVNWTEADLTALTEYLKSHEIRVVVHKWIPDEKIKAAIDQAGAALVVLDSGDPGPGINGATAPEGYQVLMRTNMEGLLRAFGASVIH
jgi:hypothetical protein